MSAWIVSKTHIDLLITAGLQFSDHGDLRWGRDAEWKQSRALTHLNASEVGSMLWAENLASVAGRYPNDRSGERPGPIGFEDEHVLTYRHEDVPGRIDPVAVLKSIACYEYQSCEHDGWKDSEGRRYCEALLKAAINRLPDYDKAPWGFDERRYFLEEGK